MVTVEHLRKVFDQSRWPWHTREPFIAVEDSSFTVTEGEIVTILGANGAGKTTTMHLLLGLLTPTSGSISYFGLPLATHRSEILSRVGFGTTYARLPSQLTVYQNLLVYGKLYGLSTAACRERIDMLLNMLGIAHLTH